MGAMSNSLAMAAGVLALACAAQPAAAQAGDAPKPNILVIVADDLGYSDVGAFGGEIATPNLDRLAAAGVRLTDFHVAPACAPTRAMLMTGSDHHLVGQGSMGVFTPEQRRAPGYEDYLNDRAASLAERLQAAGYLTVMTGKWHLGEQPERVPAARGFARSFAVLPGAHNHYGVNLKGMMKAAYSADGKPAEHPAGVYSSDLFADRLIGFIDEAKADKRPMLAYLAFTAPHWPLQAPPELIAKYKGRYDAGHAALAAERLKRMKALGLVAADVKPYAPQGLPAWSELTPEQRAIEARKMEIHAAMVDNMDSNVGKVLEALRRTGRLATTTVVFMSDNGAAGEHASADGRAEFADTWSKFLGPERAALMMSEVDNRLENLGRANSYQAIGPGWASASSAPYRLYKTYTSEGGIRSPAFISGHGVEAGGRNSDAFLNVTDVTPTLLDMAGVSATATFKGRAVLTPQGLSWRPVLKNAAQEVRTPGDAVGWELFGSRAIRKGDWKALYIQPVGFTVDYRDMRPGVWALYDLATDPGETRDLSAAQPAKMAEMMEAWRTYVAGNGVVVMFPDGASGERKP